MNRLLTFFFCALSGGGMYAQSPSGHHTLLVGTYTDGDTLAPGIFVYDFDDKAATLKRRSEVQGIANPSFLAVTADQQHVYAVSELGKGKGSVNAFKFDTASATLSPMNAASSGGNGPCYVSVDEKNRLVFAANYGGGSLSANRILPDGSLDSNTQVIQHSGKSVAKDQAGPHAHSVVVTPDGKYLLCADLGVDKIFIYRIDAANRAPLAETQPGFVSVTAGNGPRHITFHPNGRFAYVINEIAGSVTVFSYHDGQLKQLQEITMLAPGFKGLIEAADIHISPDGRFLYGSNREESNELLIYSIGKDGKLKYTGRQSTLGKGARSFTLDPTGRFLLVANLNSDEIKIFTRNARTGLLHFTGTTVALKRPACLKFASIRY